MNEQLNSLNLKYQDNKKIINEKELEINNLKEVSRALIEKQKNDLEKKEKNERISPDTHFIICKKKFYSLSWYLVSNINPKDKKIPNDKKNNYDNYKWVTELIIPKNQLNRYNKFKDDDNNISNNSYIKNLNKKLELKEEELNKLNYKNKQLNEKLQNKSSSVKNEKLYFGNPLENVEKYGLNKSNSNYYIH